MFHTIGHRSGGYIHLSYINGKETIRAQYRDDSRECASIPAARRWLTIQHRRAVAQRAAEHHAFMCATFGGTA